MIKPTFSIMNELNQPIPNNRYDEMLLKIYISKIRLLISTDGGLDTKVGNHASAAIAWSILDIRGGETIATGEWKNIPTIPLLARINRLHEKIGSHKVDIGHGELLEYCMQEESLEGEIARIVVMDSKCVRDRILDLRDKDKISERKHIREALGGLGKALVSRVNHLLEINKLKKYQATDMANNETEEDIGWLAKFKAEMKERVAIFVEIAEKWVTGSNKGHWHKQYWDSHPTRPILKI